MPFVRQVTESGSHGTMPKRSMGFDSQPAAAAMDSNHVTENRKQMTGGALIEHFEAEPVGPKKQPKQPSKQDLLDNFASIFAVATKTAKK